MLEELIHYIEWFQEGAKKYGLNVSLLYCNFYKIW